MNRTIKKAEDAFMDELHEHVLIFERGLMKYPIFKYIAQKG